LWLAPAALAQQAPSTNTNVRIEPGKFSQTRTITASARILGIDYTNRLVGLQPAIGDNFDVVAGPDVQNLDQLQAGDLVAARYVETVTLQLRKAGVATAAPTDDRVAQSAPGGSDTLGGHVARRTTVVAEIAALEPAIRRVTLKAPSGEKLRILLKDQAQYDNLQVGDHVEISFSQAMALSIIKGD
jgi:hypothetical protein